MKDLTTTRVSVIIPAFNVAGYLDRCVKSVINQSFPDFEIILLDDGSVDETAEIGLRWEEADHRVHFISKHNEGLGPTRNMGIGMAAGKYLFFLDADDWIVPECLERLVKTAEETMADVVIYDYYLTRRSDDGSFHRQPARRQLRLEREGTTLKAHPELLSRCGGTVWNKFQRKDFILQNKIHHPSHRYEDISYVYQMLTSAARIVHLPELLYEYWINRADSITNKEPYISECFMALDEMREVMEKYPHRNSCIYQLMKYSAAYLQIPLLRLEAAGNQREIDAAWAGYYRRYPIAEKVDKLKFILIGSDSLETLFRRMRFLNTQPVVPRMPGPLCAGSDIDFREISSRKAFNCLLIDFDHVDLKVMNDEWQIKCRNLAEIIDSCLEKGNGVYLLEADPKAKKLYPTIAQAENYFLNLLPEVYFLRTPREECEQSKIYRLYNKADELGELLIKRILAETGVDINYEVLQKHTGSDQGR